MYYSTNKWYGSSENITISTEATTIPKSPQPLVSEYFSDTIILEMFAKSDEISKQSG